MNIPTEEAERRAFARGQSGPGFTLMEIMITLSVVMILLAIAIPALNKTNTETKKRKAMAEVEILAAGIKQLAWDTGRWPGALIRNVSQDREIWDLRASDAGILSSTAAYSNWRGPYVPEIENDPWGNPYFFDPDYLVGNRMRVVVGSFGPNGRGRNIYDSDNIYVILK